MRFPRPPLRITPTVRVVRESAPPPETLAGEGCPSPWPGHRSAGVWRWLMPLLPPSRASRPLGGLRLRCTREVDFEAPPAGKGDRCRDGLGRRGIEYHALPAAAKKMSERGDES